MFNLASLFVEIKANDAPLKTSFEALKVKAAASSDNIGAKFSGAFAAGTAEIVSDAPKTAAAMNNVLDKLGDKAGAVTGTIRSKLAAAFTAQAVPILNDGPMTEALEATSSKVKASAGNMFTSITKALGTSVPFVGPLVVELLSLSGVLDENNADFKALSGVIEGVIAPIKAGIQYVAHAMRDWIEATVKAVKENKLLQFVLEKDVELFNYMVAKISPMIAMFSNLYEGATKWLSSWFESTGAVKSTASAMEVFLDYAYDGIENLKTAIDQAAHLFWVLKDAAMEALEPLPKYLKGVYNDFMDAFGNPAIDRVEDFGGAITTWVLDKIELVGIFVRNWPDFFQIAYLEIVDYLSSIAEAIQTIPANAAIVGNYIANNWLKYFSDVGTNIQGIFANLMTNLQSIWTAFQDWVDGKGFHPQFTDLTKGMVSTVDALPELVKPALDAHIARLKEIADIEERIGDKVYAKHKAGAKAAEVEEKKKDAAVGGDFKSQSFGIADFFAHQRQLTFSDTKEEKELARKALAEAEKTRKASEKTAELLAKGIVAKAGGGK